MVQAEQQQRRCVGRGGRVVLFRCSGFWQGQWKPELVDPQNFPWKCGDSGRQWTTDGPDLPWLPEGDKLEMIQEVLSLRATGHSSSHPKSFPRGSGFAGPPVVFAQFLSQNRVRFVSRLSMWPWPEFISVSYSPQKKCLLI